MKNESQTTLSAELIPGAEELLHALRERGYKLALIADGRPGTYVNVLNQHGLYDLFDAFAISEWIGVEKPDRRIFAHALERLGIAAQDYWRTIMVGNRLDRDIRGANQLGMLSVWFNRSPRYAKAPRRPDEVPQYTIQTPMELMQVIEEVETGRLGEQAPGS